MAERGGFEQSRPFIAQMLPRFHARLLPERSSRRQNEARPLGVLRLKLRSSRVRRDLAFAPPLLFFPVIR
jgi:hypothetical protein